MTESPPKVVDLSASSDSFRVDNFCLRVKSDWCCLVFETSVSNSSYSFSTPCSFSAVAGIVKHAKSMKYKPEIAIKSPIGFGILTRTGAKAERGLAMPLHNE